MQALTGPFSRAQYTRTAVKLALRVPFLAKWVVLALGIGEDLAHASLRFGLGRGNTEAEVDTVLDMLEENVRQLRSMGSGRRVVRQ